MTWQVVFSPSARRDLRNHLDRPVAARVIAALERLAATGYGDVKQMTDPEPGADYRLRIGPWRALFTRDSTAQTIIVARVRHRREIFRRE